MDAKVAWHTWRKILRNETLQRQLIADDWQTRACEAFTAEEQAVIAEYAVNIDRAKWFIENYQFRLVNSFTNALETGAPLTLRALLNSGFIVSEMSTKFLRAHQWHDYGPRVYSYCRDALQWLMHTQKDWALSDSLSDLMRLEYQVVSLYLSLQHGQPQARTYTGGYSQTGMARLYCSKFRLSQWLRDKKSLGISQPDRGEENFLVLMPDLNSRHKFLLLPTRSVELFRNPDSLGSSPNADDLAHLARLTAVNALVFQEVVDEVR